MQVIPSDSNPSTKYASYTLTMSHHPIHPLMKPSRVVHSGCIGWISVLFGGFGHGTMETFINIYFA